MAERLEGLGGVSEAALASVTPGMVSRVAELAERSATALDLLTHPDVLALLGQLQQSAPALSHALKRVEQLHRSGALDTLLDLTEVVHAARSSMGDGMIARLGGTVRTLAELGDTVMTSGLPEQVPALMQAAAEAREEAARNTGTVGIFGLMSAMKEPEMQSALKFMLAMARRLPAGGPSK